MEQPNEKEQERQREKLIKLLSTINKTRDSLPLLLRTFSTPLILPSPSSSTSTSFNSTTNGISKSTSSYDRSQIYKSRSNSLKNLLSQLNSELNESNSIFQSLEEKEILLRGYKGLIIKDKKEYLGLNGEGGIGGKGGREGWEKLNEVLGSASEVGKVNSSGKGKESNGMMKLEDIGGKENLSSWLLNWYESLSLNQMMKKNKIKVELLPGKDSREIELVVKGVMRCYLMLYWNKQNIVIVERVACFGLKESNKSNYLQSQFSLFQNLTNSTMEKIGRHDSQSGTSSNLLEILEYLIDPPLPF